MAIRNKAALREAIIQLENKKKVQEAELVSQFQATRNSLKPLNLAKAAFNEIAEMPDLAQGILKTAAGIGAGFVSKKLFLGRSPSFLKKIISNLVEFGVAKATVDNADKLKAFGISAYHQLFRKNGKSEAKHEKE